MKNDYGQPKTKRKIDIKEFGRIKETIYYTKKAEKNKEKEVYKPIDLGLFLTGRCNLRCTHCFEWNEDGFLNKSEKKYANGEMPIEDIKQCLDYTKEANSRLYVWGGEPLLYSKFDEFCELLKKDPRWVTMCTNGLILESKMDKLIEISENLVLLVSLDGFREYHDMIRGKGTFDRTIDNIKKIVELSKQNIYKGEVSVNCVISNGMIGKLYDFCELMEGLGINSLYICFPWYISEETAVKMDYEFERRFGDMVNIEDYSRTSWHDFKYHIDEKKIPELKEDLKHIIERVWNIRVRFQPALELDEVEEFVKGGTSCAQKKKKCLANQNRIDILHHGEVSACKLFREFTVGNLRDSNIREIWEGERMQEIRKRLGCGLMPVCSKCILLYLNGV